MTVEEAPKPQPKKSFVSEKDAPPVQKPQAPSGEKFLPAEIALTLLYNQSKIHTDLLTEIRDILRGRVTETSKPAEVAQSAPVAQVAPAPAPVPVPVQAPAPSIVPPFVQKIKDAFKGKEDVLEMLNMDIDSNSMFVILKPKQYLGSENFATVASIVRSFGKDGMYVSEGRNSHFKISKAVGQ